jgi:hypothetical protein
MNEFYVLKFGPWHPVLISLASESGAVSGASWTTVDDRRFSVSAVAASASEIGALYPAIAVNNAKTTLCNRVFGIKLAPSLASITFSSTIPYPVLSMLASKVGAQYLMHCCVHRSGNSAIFLPRTRNHQFVCDLYRRGLGAGFWWCLIPAVARETIRRYGNTINRLRGGAWWRLTL